MVIDRVHGLHATDISLNHRFTMLAASCWVMQPRRHVAVEMLDITQNQRMFEQTSYHLPEHLAKRRALMQRLHMPATRTRRSSEGTIAPPLYRANSLNNLREDLGNKLIRASSFNSLSEGPTGGARWRRKMRSRGLGRVSQQWRLNRSAGYPQQPQQQQQQLQQGQGRGRRRGRNRGRGRRGKGRNQEPITKEKLDDEIDQYMASSKYLLDKELDEIRTSFIEFEDV